MPATILRGVTLLRGATVVTPDTVLADGWVLIAGDRIVEAGAGPRTAPPDTEIVELGGGHLLPGFIDLHVHGGGGGTFDDGATGISAGLAVHRAHGTTRTLVSLVTAPVPELTAAIAAAAVAVAGDPQVLGLHLEGPFLDVTRRGVHDPAALIAPDPVVLEDFLAAGAGLVRVVTLAPEVAGGLELVRQLVDRGVHAAIGHSDASYDQARQAFAAGVDLVTHAFNGMRPLHHRDPAIIGAAMDSAGVVLEVINDGVHVHPAAVRLLRSIAPGRVALVTDAMAAAGAADGEYRLAGRPVRVTDGVARLVAGGSIAGSTLTMDAAVRQAVTAVGIPLLDAVNAASDVPARYLGVQDRFGGITPDRIADLVLTDDDLVVRAVMVAGRWMDERRP